MKNLTDKNGNILEEGDYITIGGKLALFDNGVLGIVHFGFYPDGEEYGTLKHYGWYVEFMSGGTHSLGDIHENCAKL